MTGAAADLIIGGAGDDTLEEFDAGNGKVLTGANVDTLVSAMAMFAPPTTSTMPQSTHDALAWTLSSTWQ